MPSLEAPSTAGPVFHACRLWGQGAAQRCIGGVLTCIGGMSAAWRPVDLWFRHRFWGFIGRRLGWQASLPVTGFEGQRPGLQAWAKQRGRRVVWVETSGTADAPKRVPLDGTHIRRAKLWFFLSFLRLLWAHPVRRRNLFVFSTFDPEPSALSGQLTANHRRPSRVSLWQAPFRAQSDPAWAPLRRRYCDHLLRALILTVADPGVWYATNPATMVLFLERLSAEGAAFAELCAWVRGAPEAAALRRCLARIAMPGAEDRLRAAAKGTVDPQQLFPSLSAVWTWTGGQTDPFVRRLTVQLGPRVPILSMYAMSTEVIATAMHWHRGALRHVPAVPGVYAEFLPEAADDRATDMLRTPFQLRRGERYTHVVTTQTGLRRYQTEDVFVCAGHVGPWPDLRFVGRRGRSYSFTGEKLSEEQVQLAFDAVRTRAGDLGAYHLVLVPTAEAPGPRYRLAVVGDAPPPSPLDDWAAATDRALAEVNREFAAKRESGRLGPVEAVHCTWSRYLALRGLPEGAVVPSQMKHPALLTRCWETVLEPPAAGARPAEPPSR